ncbi:MAG: hypothetical protein LLG05_01415 [Porphyromonadaceae bacterium]|nr:hypothetical protein [Porphyromonadaceae bacterium]
MAKKQRFIELSTEKAKEIASIKGVSVQTVHAALRYETSSTLSMLIRAWALQPENGGVLYEAQHPNK